jgi:hypothetical protein
MMVTARQLADLHKAAGGKGQIVLPYRARLTPLAADWVRSGKVTIGYSDAAATASEKPAEKPVAASPAATGGFLWWCDGPCGQVKAAISMEARQTGMREIDPSPAKCPLTAALKIVGGEVKGGKAIGAVIVVESGAAAVVLANRSPALRAIVGTALATVDQGVNQVAANVLILEHPRLSLAQARNLIARFVRGKRLLSDQTRSQIAELSS